MTKKPNYVFDTDDELCHWGIKGQRWGFRRFQNEDGSLTPEGRERYGEGGAKSKSDVQKYKAKVSFKTQQYKADLKSKAQIAKDKRAAKEERNRLKEQAKTERTAQKEAAKKERENRPAGMKLSRTKNMSDEDLQKAVERLKLQSEYNKQYALATKPDGALAKADRFFEGATGKAVIELSKSILPGMLNAATKSILDNKLKYSNALDREKRMAEIDKDRAEAEKSRALAKSSEATANATNQKAINDMNESNNKIYLDRIKSQQDAWKMTQENIRDVGTHVQNVRIKEEENLRARGTHQQDIRLKEKMYGSSSSDTSNDPDKKKKRK